MKNPFEKQTDRSIRQGLFFGSFIYISWFVLTFCDKDRQSWFVWMMRGGVTLLFLYCWCESLREMKRRRKKP
jgi:cell division protein FtsW (lipid II flippase)